MKWISRIAAGMAVTAVFALTLTACAQSEGATPEITMYQNASCGCCHKWADYLRDQGYRVEQVTDRDMVLVKAERGVPPALHACHTAVVDGYVVEGHVPAEDVARLLQERPDVKGIAVAGMPIGSPGMEGPNPERYQTIAFGEQGQLVFAEH